MRVLVSGASGAIGSALCDALLARGDEVVGLSRDPERARRDNPKVGWHSWQPTMERPPAAAFDGVDGVVNLVGEPISQRWTEKAKTAIMESRRVGTRNLVQAITALEQRPSVMVSGSAIGYYGDRGESLVDESTARGEGFAAEVTEEWERAADGVGEAGVRLVIVRTGLVLEPVSGLLKQLLTPFRMGVGGPVAGGAQYMSWIHVDDEVGILLWALDNPKLRGIVNATAPGPVTNRAFSKTLGSVLGRPSVVPVPGFAVNLVFGEEFAETVRGGARVMPRRTLDLGYEFEHPELEEALRDLLR
ncbi:MAG: TIGR01777 family oxidoreductase [Solirubrobacterales bacterium]